MGPGLFQGNLGEGDILFHLASIVGTLKRKVPGWLILVDCMYIHRRGLRGDHCCGSAFSIRIPN